MDVGVIGVGTMGRNHVRVYSELKSVDSVAVFDVDRKTAEEIGGRLGANVYGSVEELLIHVDAISICVPTQLHAGIADKAFAARCAVLIEKPICATSDEAKELVKKAPDGITVGVGHIERFNPDCGGDQKDCRTTPVCRNETVQPRFGPDEGQYCG